MTTSSQWSRTVTRAAVTHLALGLLALGAASCAGVTHGSYVPYLPEESPLELVEHYGEQGLVSRQDLSSVVVRTDSSGPWSQAGFQVYVLNHSQDQTLEFGPASVALEARTSLEDGHVEFTRLAPMSPEELDELHEKLVSEQRRKEHKDAVGDVTRSIFTGLLVLTVVVGLVALCTAGGGCHGGTWDALGRSGGGDGERARRQRRAVQKRRALKEAERVGDAIPRVIGETSIAPGDAVMGDFWFIPPSWRPSDYELVITVGPEEHRFPYRVKLTADGGPEVVVRHGSGTAP
ncbi:MAG: hypothetical protein VX938_00975 [Myxococcota bacterium]|nr:hypothetical protein [Myxococcota bacterium]